jgi:hypothetical protein
MRAVKKWEAQEEPLQRPTRDEAVELGEVSDQTLLVTSESSRLWAV